MEIASTEIEAPDVEALLPEIERYLAAVEVFRAEGHEPRWSSDDLNRFSETHARCVDYEEVTR
jgi:hypothetical protein